MTKHIGVVYIENDIELSWAIDRVQSVTKTRQDNDMTEQIDVVYVKNDIELSWLMRLGVVFDEDKTDDLTNRTGLVYVENNIKLSWLVGWDADCDKNQIGQLAVMTDQSRSSLWRKLDMATMWLII